MFVTVLTPDQKVFEGEARSVKVPGSGGQFQVLDNHAPIVSSLDKGDITIQAANGTTTTFSIQSGFIEVLNNRVSLLVAGVSKP